MSMSLQVAQMRAYASTIASTRAFPRPWRSSSISCSSPLHLHTVVDHVVLFKVKNGTPPQLSQAMLDGLRSLKSIDSVVELSAGSALQPGIFTHALHSRYRDKDALAEYANNSFHLDVISKYIAPIVEDRLALDWEADLEHPSLNGNYGAVRIAIMKPKENLSSGEVPSVINLLKRFKARYPVVKQISAGRNFSPARAKGFEWGCLALFPSLQELHELTKNEEHEDLQLSEVMESFVVFDYSTT